MESAAAGPLAALMADVLRLAERLEAANRTAMTVLAGRLSELKQRLPAEQSPAGSAGASLSESREASRARHGLTARQVEIVRLIADGRTNRQIADELVISLNTVLRHITNIFDRTGVSNRAEAVAFATRHGLLDLLPASQFPATRTVIAVSARHRIPVSSDGSGRTSG